MNMQETLASFILATLVAFPAWAATRTVTLSVPGMSCAACPITVKKALSKVEGVGRIEVSLDRREAVVQIDDGKASPERLIEATKQAGYPSTVKK